MLSFSRRHCSTRTCAALPDALHTCLSIADAFSTLRAKSSSASLSSHFTHATPKISAAKSSKRERKKRSSQIAPLIAIVLIDLSNDEVDKDTLVMHKGSVVTHGSILSFAVALSTPPTFLLILVATFLL